MKGRKIIQLNNVGSSVIDGDVPGDWVLIGVLVDKLPPRWVQKCPKARKVSNVIVSAASKFLTTP